MLAIVAALVLSGCASVAQQCGMADVRETLPMPRHGEVTVQWEVVSLEDLNYVCSAGQARTNPYLGCAIGGGSRWKLWTSQQPTFNDPCTLLLLGHELGHAAGAQH